MAASLADAPIVPPFPSSLSPSRASDFMSCPLKFRFRSIDRIPEEPSAVAIRGTLVHAALENLYDLPSAERTPDAAAALVRQAFEELVRTDPAEADAVRGPDGGPPDVRELLAGYFSLEDPRRLEPHSRELGVSARIDEEFEIRGYIDRVDRNAAGQVRIVDYKTGRSPGQGFEAKAMFQMRFYALAWWRMTGEIPMLLRLLYLGSTESLSYEPSESDLLATERKVLALRAAISTAADAGRFEPQPSRLCDWCSYRSLCPSWGGEPPPLPPRDQWQSGAATASEAEELLSED